LLEAAALEAAAPAPAAAGFVLLGVAAKPETGENDGRPKRRSEAQAETPNNATLAEHASTTQGGGLRTFRKFSADNLGDSLLHSVATNGK
jgi:hypothetical protein